MTIKIKISACLSRMTFNRAYEIIPTQYIQMYNNFKCQGFQIR